MIDVSVKRNGRMFLESVSALRPQNWDALRIGLRGTGIPMRPNRTHLIRRYVGLSWLKTSQVVGEFRGVIGLDRSWVVKTYRMAGCCPETTGYIIETLLRYYDLTGDPDAVVRAKKMTDWETSIQLNDGGIQGGRSDERPVVAAPSIRVRFFGVDLGI